MQLGLTGKTALVTGGSKGIDLETARAPAREGGESSDLLGVRRRLQKLRTGSRRQHKSKSRPKSLDVTKVDQIETIPRIVHQKLGRIDLLVKNAGTGTYKPFLEMTDAELVEGMVSSRISASVSASYR